MGKILYVITSYAGGAFVGGAFVAFIYMLDIIPRLIELTDTDRYMNIYEDIYMIGALLFTIIYYTEISFNIGKILIVIIGLIFGIYIGMISSAIAEVFDVVPIVVKKLKLKKKLNHVIVTISLGKIFGSLYYFIFL